MILCHRKILWRRRMNLELLQKVPSLLPYCVVIANEHRAERPHVLCASAICRQSASLDVPRVCGVENCGDRRIVECTAGRGWSRSLCGGGTGPGGERQKRGGECSAEQGFAGWMVHFSDAPLG